MNFSLVYQPPPPVCLDSSSLLGTEENEGKHHAIKTKKSLESVLVLFGGHFQTGFYELLSFSLILFPILCYLSFHFYFLFFCLAQSRQRMWFCCTFEKGHQLIFTLVAKKWDCFSLLGQPEIQICAAFLPDHCRRPHFFSFCQTEWEKKMKRSRFSETKISSVLHHALDFFFSSISPDV